MKTPKAEISGHIYESMRDKFMDRLFNMLEVNSHQCLDKHIETVLRMYHMVGQTESATFEI